MCIARDEKKPPEFSLYKAVKQAERGAPALLGGRVAPGETVANPAPPVPDEWRVWIAPDEIVAFSSALAPPPGVTAHAEGE